MKKPIAVGVSLVALLFASACENRKAEEERLKKEAEAKARAEAARKEMEALPKAFKSEPFFKLNEPEQKAAPVNQPEKSPQETVPQK